MSKIILSKDLDLDSYQKDNHVMLHKTNEFVDIMYPKGPLGYIVKFNSNDTCYISAADISGIPLSQQIIDEYSKIIPNTDKIQCTIKANGDIEYYDDDLLTESIFCSIKYEHQLQNFLNLINAPDSSALIDYLRKI